MSRRKINQITVLLLLIGFGGALVIYLTANSARGDPLLGDPLAAKKYLRELRVIGGEANVLAARFQEWFAGLWHGEGLAVLTVGVTLVFRFMAAHPDSAATDSPEDMTPPPRGLE